MQGATASGPQPQAEIVRRFFSNVDESTQARCGYLDAGTALERLDPGDAQLGALLLLWIGQSGVQVD